MKRTRRTKAQVEQLERQILDVLEQDHPQSLRHIFYRLTDPRLPEPVEKTTAGYRAVGLRVREMRRGGRLAYEWISDITRTAWYVNTFDDAGDFLDRVAGLYREDAWRDIAVQVEVWVESRSIASVLQADCERMGVPLYPCGGFSSMTFAHEAAMKMNRDGRPGEVVFIGDYDDEGQTIGVALERELRSHLDVPLSFERVAVTEEQVRVYNLPTKPAKAGKKRTITRTVEAETMPAGIMRQLVIDKVESYLPAGLLKRLKIVEAAEQQDFRFMARHVKEKGLDGVLDILENGQG